MPPGSDYQLHRYFVAGARTDSVMTRQVQKTLDKRFSRSVGCFARAKCGDELAQLWNEAVVHGDIAGPYWAVMTHPVVSSELSTQAHGEVHMLSHISGASNRARLKRLEVVERDRDQLRQALSRARAKNMRLAVTCEQQAKTLERQRVRLAETERALEGGRARVVALEQGEELARLRRELAIARQEARQQLARAGEAERSVKHWSGFAEEFRRRCQMLESELEECSAVRGSLQGELEGALKVQCAAQRAAPEGSVDCTVDLGGRCVLYLGGRANLVPHLRVLVEERKGRFLHNDGGPSEGCPRLVGHLSKADAVLCPVDCVSHDACLRAKQFCKRTGKPIVMLRNSGLSTFTRALQDLVSHDHALFS